MMLHVGHSNGGSSWAVASMDTLSLRMVLRRASEPAVAAA